MSPGPTFERVYLEFKRQLREGTRPPGTPLEPAVIGDEPGTSFTPVRDALHRLVGEGLVENPQHNGFSVPHLTEQALRDLYAWNGQLIAMMLGRLKGQTGAVATGLESAQDDALAMIEGVFLAIAGASGNREQTKTIVQLNDRLAPCRMKEAAVIADVREEVTALLQPITRHDLVATSRASALYHKRRIAAVPHILSKLAAR